MFPARNLHLQGIFHGYVSHNQMVVMGFIPPLVFRQIAGTGAAREARDETAPPLSPPDEGGECAKGGSTVTLWLFNIAMGNGP